MSFAPTAASSAHKLCSTAKLHGIPSCISSAVSWHNFPALRQIHGISTCLSCGPSTCLSCGPGNPCLNRRVRGPLEPAASYGKSAARIGGGGSYGKLAGLKIGGQNWRWRTLPTRRAAAQVARLAATAVYRAEGRLPSVRVEGERERERERSM